MVLCVVHALIVGIRSLTLTGTHLLYKGFMPHYNVWTRHGEIGVMMEDGEEEDYNDNYLPP